MITYEQVIAAIAEFYKSGTGNGGMRKALEAYEQSKPKPEPVAYKVCNPAGCVLVESRKSAEKLSSEYGNGTYQPLYTTPITREPLSEDFLLRLADECTTQFFNGVHQNATIHFARAIEKAHGIGVTND